VTSLIGSGALQVLVVAFGIGIVVGLTGMGGGALMTPALIFLGIPPTAAVANDLVAAAINKSAGAAVHLRHGSPNRVLVKWLVLGSVPMALLGSWLVTAIGGEEDQQKFLKVAIGCALMLTAVTYAMRMYFELARGIEDDPNAPDPHVHPLPTFAIGAVGGLLVGITSVGSGSLIMVSLLLLYPALSAVRLVGTDLVQAIPLVIAAAIAHVLSSGIDLAVLIPLIVGGTPGTLLGARLTSVVSQSIVRRGIVMVLSLTGLGMLKVPAVWVGILGAAMAILGPVMWGLLRQVHGVPAFEHLSLRTHNKVSGSD
jgi:Predicted permeases